MRGDKERWLAPSATPWDDADVNSLGPAETLVMACHRDIYRYRGYLALRVAAGEREAHDLPVGHLRFHEEPPIW